MRILHREQKSEMGAAMASGMANSEMSRPQSSQDQLDQALGINPFLLYDSDAQDLIRSLAFVKTVKEGKDGGEPTESFTVLPKFAALAIQSGYTVRASNLTPIDAELGILSAKMVCRRIKMKMTEQEYEAGGALIVDAVLNSIIIPNNLSAIGGFIAKMTKVSPKSMEVTYREAKKAGEGFTP